MFNSKNKEKETKKFRILSVDGGGKKGIFTAYAIHQLKIDYNIDILDYFDFVIGTSTGSIILASLLLGIPTQEIYQSYIDETNDPFHQKYSYVEMFSQPFGSMYKNDILKHLLKKSFGSITIEELDKKSNKLFVFAATNFNEGKPILFGSHEFTSINKVYNNYPLWKAILTSSSAPTYFPPIIDDLTNHMFFDGGVWANNPALVGYSLAVGNLGIDDKDIEILSFGQSFLGGVNFSAKTGLDGIKDLKNNSMINLSRSTMVSQINSTNYLVSLLLKDRMFRYSPFSNVKNVKVDNINDEFIEYTKFYYERNKEKLRKFILGISNDEYFEGIEKRYN